VTAELRAQGITVDDDNDPAPENVPAPNAAGPAASSGIFKDTWGFEGCEYRQHMVGRTFQRAALIGVNAECSSLLTPGALLKIFLPVNFIETVIIPQTNLSLNPPLDIDEFFTYLGLWFAMSTCYFSGDRDMFWSSKEITFESGAPYRFHDFMSRNRFNGITQALRFTNIPSPAFRDRFHEVRQLIFEWNVNMENKFSPSWISVIDESMSKWLSEYTCPGWMVVPRKPHPFGNEYHTACCGKSGILWALELVEGKDRPRELGPKEFDSEGATVGLLKHLTKSIWYSGRAIVLDSGFCVLAGLVALRLVGVFAAALIKKRRYWPKYIPGDDIIQHFDDKEVGAVDALFGTLNGVNFHVFAMKEPDYVMQIMSTWQTLREMEKGSTARTIKVNGQETRVTFKYREPFYNHYKYRYLVDVHNQRRHSPISLEDTWATKHWPCRVFAFLLAISEVNAKLASEYFGTVEGKKKLNTIEFRKK
jgi:hypothetical protein